jgi:hypothetical protein
VRWPTPTTPYQLLLVLAFFLCLGRWAGLHRYDPSRKRICRVSCFESCMQQCTLVLDNQRCRRCSSLTTTWHPMPSSHRSSLPWQEVMIFSWGLGYGNLRRLMFETVARQSNMDMDMAELTIGTSLFQLDGINFRRCSTRRIDFAPFKYSDSQQRCCAAPLRALVFAYRTRGLGCIFHLRSLAQTLG